MSPFRVFDIGIYLIGRNEEIASDFPRNSVGLQKRREEKRGIGEIEVKSCLRIKNPLAVTRGFNL